MPLPQQPQQQTRNGLPYLKIQDLQVEKKLAKIQWVGSHDEADMPNEYDHSLLVKVEFRNGRKFLLSLAHDSRVLEEMQAHLPKDKTKWIGRYVFLFLEMVNPVKETMAMRAEVRPEEKAAEKTAAASGGTK